MVAWQEKMEGISQHRLTSLGRLCLYKILTGTLRIAAHASEISVVERVRGHLR